MGKPRILLVDDNPVILLSEAESLRDEGYEVSLAETGEECERMAREEQPDLILLDVQLPDVNGMEVSRRLKEHPATRDLFIVLLSSQNISSEDQARGLHGGADGYIAQPVERREMLARVEAMLRIQRAEQQLRQARADLEVKVEERTAELASANEALEEEIVVRKKAEAGQTRLAHRLDVLCRLDKAIQHSTDPAVIATEALRRLRDLLPYDRGAVVDLLPATGASRLLGLAGESPVEVGKPVALPENLESLLQGQVIEETGVVDRFGGGERLVRWGRTLDVPLRAEGKLIGYLQLARRGDQVFDLDQVEMVEEAANQMAVAIQQALLLEETNDARQQLYGLALRLMETQEHERSFIARELHDEIGQCLTSLKLGLDRLLARTDGDLGVALMGSAEIIVELMDRVRQLSLDLRPSMLDDLGLLPALEWYFNRCQHQQDLTIQFRYRALETRLPRWLETAFFRIIQAALSNVVQHAQVGEATVRFWASETHVGVQVDDPGIGCVSEPSPVTTASGSLRTWRERVELLGGQFSFESVVGSGTCLTVELPLTPPRHLPTQSAHDFYYSG